MESYFLYLKRWRHLTTWNHTEASRRWTAEYYISQWSNGWKLRLTNERGTWAAIFVREWVKLGIQEVHHCALSHGSKLNEPDLWTADGDVKANEVAGPVLISSFVVISDKKNVIVKLRTTFSSRAIVCKLMSLLTVRAGSRCMVNFIADV